MKRVLIIFAKEPVLGKVKTRLSGCLSREGRLALYKAFFRDVITLTKRVRCEERCIAYEGFGRTPSFLQSVAGHFTFFAQEGTSLGERIHHAFCFAAERGATRTVIIGSDAPTLPPAYVQGAFTKLSSHDIVLGPSLDGGYYLVGLRCPEKELFRRIRWGTNRVFMQTLTRIRQAKRTAVLLPLWYDVDDARSLGFLRDEFRRGRSGAPKTRKAILLADLERCGR